MTYPILLFIAGVFVLAGFVKGVVGLGLPAISMGLLALVMAPADAASILILPTVATNLWQMAAGPNLKPIISRLWPVLLGVICGTLAGVEMGLGLAAVPHRKGGAQAAMDYLAETAAAELARAA